MLSKFLKIFSKGNFPNSKFNAVSYERGYEVLFDIDTVGKGIYADTGEEVTLNRPCKRCGKEPTLEGHDACLGELPGVKFACCGHGKEGYVVFENGVVIKGYFEVDFREDKSELIKEYFSSNKKN